MKTAIGLVMLLVAGGASAQAPNARERKLVDSAQAHYEHGEYKQALADFGSAYKLTHDPDLLFMLGESYRQLGDRDSAVQKYRAYLKERPFAPNKAELEKFIAAKPSAPPPSKVTCKGDCGTLAGRAHDNKDYALAVALAQHGCDHNDFASEPCQILGWFYELGDGVTKDPNRAVALYKRGCDGGEAWGCAHLGWAYQNGVGVPKDAGPAARLLEQSCNRATVGCGTIAFFYNEGQGVPRDYGKAFSYAQRGCDANESSSQPCQLLGLLYATGHGTATDGTKAFFFYKKACENGEAWGCAHLGWAYQNGLGVSKSDVQALRWLQLACDKYTVGCGAVSWFYHEGAGTTRNDAKAVAAAKKGCDAGEAISQPCQQLGWLYEKGDGVPQDMARAAQLYQKGCSDGEGWGCAHLGWSYQQGNGVTRDPSMGGTLLQKACTMGISAACNH